MCVTFWVCVCCIFLARLRCWWRGYETDSVVNEGHESVGHRIRRMRKTDKKLYRTENGASGFAEK